MNQDNVKDNPFKDIDILSSGPNITPDPVSMKVKKTPKLLVVIFIIDCSKTMNGKPIQAVNGAMKELQAALKTFKADQGLDVKMAIMSFASSVKWDLQLTDIDEVLLDKLTTRPGLTMYGSAFHELGKVLTEDAFLKHTGKVARPVIMFLTDGGPSDNYEDDLNQLLKNPYFAGANRSAVLVGDAIDDMSARNAVSRFVSDPDVDIRDANGSTEIIQNMIVQTMIDVKGDPKGEPKAAGGAVPAGGDKPEPKQPDKMWGDVVFPEDDVFPDTFPDDNGGEPIDFDPFGGTDGDMGNIDPFGDSDGNDPFGGVN